MADFVHTITFDNGKEFATHQDITHALKATIFFATPYHAWERGLNENTNGLIRDFFPKGTDFESAFRKESDLGLLARVDCKLERGKRTGTATLPILSNFRKCRLSPYIVIYH